MSEFKENVEARIQRDMSILFESMLTAIRDEGNRRGLPANQIEKKCLDLITFFEGSKINFDHFNASVFLDHGANSFQAEGKRKSESRNRDDKKELKEAAENQEEIDRYRIEIKTFMEAIFSRYRCPVALEIPDVQPVRIPTHPGLLQLKQQIWDRAYIAAMAQCPLTKVALPRAWWGVDPHENAKNELFLFLVAADEWLQTIPAALMDENSEIIKELKEAQKEIREVLAKENHTDIIKTAKERLASLKAGKAVAGVSVTDKALLNFLIRTTAVELQIKEKEEKAKQNKLRERKETAERAIYKNQISEFNNMFSIFQCPIDFELPKHPIRIVNHPVIQQRRQVYIQRNAILLDRCPLTHQPLNMLDAGAMASARSVLCLFAVATDAWLLTLPEQLQEEMISVRDDIDRVLNEALNAEDIQTARENYPKLKKNQNPQTLGISKEDEELLGFLIRSPEADMKIRQEIERREAEARMVAEELRRKLAAEEEAHRREVARRAAAAQAPRNAAQVLGQGAEGQARNVALQQQAAQPRVQPAVQPRVQPAVRQLRQPVPVVVPIVGLVIQPDQRSSVLFRRDR